MYQIAVVLLSFFAVASAKCDNACSGHGTCDIHSKCTCYDNWGLGLSHDSGDCSQRICPFEFAWVDKPDKIGNHHKYAECAAKGICNRDTGDCECFPGYEGKACQRTACPNDCSGHGQCAFIENLPFQSVPMDYTFGTFVDDLKTFDYGNWDQSKTRGCVCDAEYGDVDCSKRMCPYGTDVMDVRNNMLAAAKYQVQQIYFIPDDATADALDGYTFALTFKSRLNETFTTRPIVYHSTTADLHDFVLDIQESLMELPNKVIDRVEVHGGSSSGFTSDIVVNITFTGENVQGPQHLLAVRDLVCGDGCTPKLTGLQLLPRRQNVTELQLSDFNSYECGRRGKCDYSTGICNCFAGYTGLSCNTITALV